MRLVKIKTKLHSFCSFDFFWLFYFVILLKEIFFNLFCDPSLNPKLLGMRIKFIFIYLKWIVKINIFVDFRISQIILNYLEIFSTNQGGVFFCRSIFYNYLWRPVGKANLSY